MLCYCCCVVAAAVVGVGGVVIVGIGVVSADVVAGVDCVDVGTAVVEVSFIAAAALSFATKDAKGVMIDMMMKCLFVCCQCYRWF